MKICQHNSETTKQAKKDHFSKLQKTLREHNSLLEPFVRTRLVPAKVEDAREREKAREAAVASRWRE